VNVSIPGWSAEIERSFKEVLFRFLEQVQSTKAALYLLAPDGSYRLATQYGFRRRDLLASEHVPQDAIIKKVRAVRNKPVVINDPSEFPEIADYLEGSGTARILLVPLYGGSRVLGFVAARDKGRKRLFEPSDAESAMVIADAFLELLGQAKMYEGHEAQSPKSRAPQTVVARASITDPMLSSLVDKQGLGQFYDTAAGLALRRQVVAAALSTLDDKGGATVVFVGEASGDVDHTAIQRHQAEALRQVNAPMINPGSWRVETRRIPSAGERSQSRLVATAVLLSSKESWVVGSVVGIVGSRAATDALEALQRVATAVREASCLRQVRRRLARRFLQPGVDRYPDLEAHSLAVSRLCWRMAQELGLDDDRVEEAALAGLLHDVGMRELDYSRIYRHDSPGEEELLEYQRHVEVGAEILEDTGLDRIAAAVRHHHERWDGTGYPDRLPGVAIPFLARLVHVAEVFDVLTAPHSYRAPVGPRRALSVMKTAAGHQFDPEVVDLMARVAG